MGNQKYRIKLQNIQNLEKALEIAKNNLNSPSPMPKKDTKKSNIKEVDSTLRDDDYTLRGEHFKK